MVTIAEVASRFRIKLAMLDALSGYSGHDYGLLSRFASLDLGNAADQIATNRAKSTEIPGGYFTPQDVDIQAYIKKIIELYYRDVKQVHYEKLIKRFMKEGYPPEKAEAMAEEKVWEISTRAANKAVESHKAFLNQMRQMNIPPGSTVVAPGAGFAHEQVVDPSYDWVGLEYQKALADMATERNKQLGISGKTKQWSFIEAEPEEKLGEGWKDKLRTITDDAGNPTALYLKHACGGITDGSLYKAVEAKIPYIFAATCCAFRYPEVSFRVLNPTNDDGSPMSFDEYMRLAKKSRKQDETGKAYVKKIDNFRQKFLEDNGYTVERGESNHGPYLMAKLLKH